MQRLVYEGNDPEQLLRDVWSKHGTAVRLSEPVEIRRGGLFGFFAKVVYRIEVEPLGPDAPAPAGPAGRSRPAGRPGTAPAPAPPAQGTRGIGPRRPPSAGPWTGEPRVVPGPPPPAGMPGTPGISEPSTADRLAAATLGRLADDTVDVLELGSNPGLPVSFEAVLDGVASSLGEPPGSFHPGSVVPRTTLDDLMTQSTPPPGALWEPPGPAQPPGAPSPPTGPAPPPPAGARSPGPRPPGAPSGPRTLPPAGMAARRTSTVLELLYGAGFPEHLLAGIRRLAAPDLSLEEAFASLPAAPGLPHVPGSLIAVVGEGAEARAAAQALAVELGADPDHVAVAAPWRAARSIPPDLFVRTPEEAAALSPGWRRDRIGLVAVGAPLVPGDHGWARAMLAALRPSLTLGQQPATAKPEDVARWARRLGGIDALLVEQIESTSSPAAALAAGIPVARIDGALATPKRWAQLTADLVRAR
ncbi:MAG TPA: hypothetical protein VGL60_09550 [Acidimicrobiales bacterium]